MRLPPYDTDTFYGDFVAWPTFHDLLTTLYINNSRLSKIEKLFHLIQKSGGDARNIVYLKTQAHQFKYFSEQLLDVFRR